MSLIDATIPIGHQVAIVTGQDSHGNDVVGYPNPPIQRMAIAIYPPTFQRAKPDPVTVEEAERTETELFVEVPDATLYKKPDRVLLSGVSYRVEGLPRNWGSDAPFGFDAEMFGGTLHVRRVT